MEQLDYKKPGEETTNSSRICSAMEGRSSISRTMDLANYESATVICRES
jgi:hypothetical protein